MSGAAASRSPRLPAGPPSDLPADVAAEIAGDLAAAEASLTRLSVRHATRIADAARHNLEAGGKRLRPLLTCAVMRALGRDPRPAIDAVAAVELVHAGSLLHDDVIDGAETRRGRSSVHTAFDVHTAILAGDVLLTWAVDRLARLGPRALQVAMAEALRDVCEGEVLERERRFDADGDLGHVRRVNRLKTAALFGYAAEAGALLAEAGEAERSAARAHGLALGEAFQTVDDLLDWEGDAGALGKPRGRDLAEGLLTIPVALGIERDPPLREEVRALWRAARGNGGRAEVPAGLRERLTRSGAFDATRELARADVARAVGALDGLPAGTWTRLLALGAARAVERDR